MGYAQQVYLVLIMENDWNQVSEKNLCSRCIQGFNERNSALRAVAQYKVDTVCDSGPLCESIDIGKEIEF